MTMKAFVVYRDVVEVAGPQALDFLQGQLSQDISRLRDGDAALSFLLQPQGKVDALVRVTRLDGERFLLDVDGGFGGAVVSRLERFKLRVKCELAALDGWRCVAVRGEGWSTASPPTPVVAVVPAFWAAHDGVDYLGPDAAPPVGADLGNADEFERLRIEAGFPKMGAELDERTIPAESGVVDRAVSFTKGCYTGQELVARIDSRGGNVPRRLRLVTGAGLAVGAAVVVDGRDVGAITSAAGDVALAYVHRDVEPPAEATVAGQAARIHALPAVT